MSETEGEHGWRAETAHTFLIMSQCFSQYFTKITTKASFTEGHLSTTPDFHGEGFSSHALASLLPFLHSSFS